MIADEPTNGLDQEATEAFFELLRRLFPDAAKLIITHDISIARLCDRVTVLCGGKMCETGPAGEVLSDPRHPYTEALLGALVESGMLETQVLRKTENRACPFYSRCSYARDYCISSGSEPRHQRRGETEWWCTGS